MIAIAVGSFGRRAWGEAGMGWGTTRGAEFSTSGRGGGGEISSKGAVAEVLFGEASQ